MSVRIQGSRKENLQFEVVDGGKKTSSSNQDKISTNFSLERGRELSSLDQHVVICVFI